MMCMIGSDVYTYGNVVYMRSGTSFNYSDYPALSNYMGENRVSVFDSGKAGWAWYCVAKYL